MLGVQREVHFLKTNYSVLVYVLGAEALDGIERGFILRADVAPKKVVKGP